MTETGYTDGTQCQGAFCPGAPPPLAPYFEQPCKTDVIDPPSSVYVTEHFKYGTVAPVAGAVPVVADAHAVFPYHGVAPGKFTVDIEAQVAGKRGFRADTWNIGEGVTVWVPFDCRTPETTTSTTPTTVESTTTTTAGEVSTPIVTTQTTVVSVAVPTHQLPVTGASPLLGGGGFAALVLGLALVAAARRRARR